jgi:hypothetical protein
MGLDDRANNKMQAVARFRSETLEYVLEDTASRPPIEPVMRCRVRPIPFRQITPRHTSAQYTEDTIQHKTIIHPSRLAGRRQ